MATPTSGQQAAAQNGTGRRRKVASAAGAARYHKPIGSEIGQARDASHAAIQSDQGARKNYGDLINGDAAAQRKALDGMGTEDLNKLADIAFSFKSTDPKVVQLRIAARNAQARRGIRVPVGQTQTKASGVRTAAKVAVGSKGVKGKPVAKKAAPAPARNMRGSVKAMSQVGPASARLIELSIVEDKTGRTPRDASHTSKLGNFPIPDVAHLRKAVNAIGRAKPEHRPIIARHIISRARALNAEHLVSDHIKHYARGHREPGTVGMSRVEADEIELAGRWKHGYIPLDAEALASKMKGRTGGKRWWGDGTHGGVSGHLKPHGSPKSGSPGRGVARPHQVSAEQKALGRSEREARLQQSQRAVADRGKAYYKISSTPEYQRAEQIASNRAYKNSYEKTSRAERDRIAKSGASKPTRQDVEQAARELQREREIYGGKTRSEAYRQRFDRGMNHTDIEEELKGIEARRLLAERKSGTVKRGSATSTPQVVDGSTKRTNVVKSGSAETKPRGAIVNDTYTRGHAGVKDGSGKVPTTASVGNALKKAGFAKSTSVKATTNHRGQQVGSGSRTAGYEVRKGLKAGEIEVRIESAHRGSSRGLSPQDAARRKTEEQHFVSALEESGFSVTKQGEWHIVTGGSAGTGSETKVKVTPKQLELLRAGAAHPNGEVRVRNAMQGESLAAQGLTKKIGSKIYLTDKGRAYLATLAGGQGKA